MRIAVSADINITPTDIINMREAEFAPRQLIQVLAKNGATPVVLPPVDNPTPGLINSMLEGVDGLIIPGGPDVSPRFQGEDPEPGLGPTTPLRDEFEMVLIPQAIKAGIPLLGICRGQQAINIALGGSVYQDLGDDFGQPVLQHSQKTAGNLPTHFVTIDEDSALGQTLGNRAFVNSRHHQAVHQVADQLHVVASAADGVIEALENDDASIQTVQWHPENLWPDDPRQEQIFTAFLKRVAQ